MEKCIEQKRLALTFSFQKWSGRYQKLKNERMRRLFPFSSFFKAEKLDFRPLDFILWKIL